MFKKSSSKEDGSWLSLSDLMTVLMVLFLIIAVIIAAESSRRLKDVQGVIQTFIDQENILCKNLKRKLNNNFRKSDLEVNCNPIRITFKNPEYKFPSGEYQLTESFKKALDKLFPIYLKTIKEWEMSDFVDEIRIEGHTDSVGKYIDNMVLSQKRSRSVLEYIINMNHVKETEERFLWTRNLLTANGLSFSRLLSNNGELLDPKFIGAEDKEKSRRVEIKLRTQAREILFFINSKNR